MDNEKLRHYLEQVIVTQKMGGALPKDAVDVAAEVESHCRTRDGNLLDPFAEFGDPEKYAREILEPRSLLKTLLSAVTSFLLILPFISLAVGLLNIFGVESISKTVLLAAIAYVSSQIILAVLLIEFGLSKRDSETRANISLVGKMLAALAIVGFVLAYIYTPNEGVRYGVATYVVILVSSLLLGWLAIVLNSYLTKPTMPVVTDFDGEVTTEIVHDMNTAGYLKGWVKYSIEGDKLEDVSLLQWFGLKK